ncbi:unnamed protein product [Arctia plantaginis]|uniref:Farnesyl pyrophosphate synthase n=1 Tax=Arctia plantaginis TaxID=874455 RepID=A0A8S1BFC9_ARCPL|nr:unnamed protein product [Arctia plantaginis]
MSVVLKFFTCPAKQKQTPEMNIEEKFREELPGILGNLMASPKLSQIPEVATWVKKILEYNLRGSKYFGGVMVALAYDMLEKPENITEENQKLSRVLGWCGEMARCAFCISDDLMEKSTTRHGNPCWYLMPNVGLGAVNDCMLVFSSVMETIEIYFLETPYFKDIVRLIHKTILYCSMGQQADFMLLSHHVNKDYSQFTIERYETTIVPYVCRFCTFELPVLLALTIMKDVDMNTYDGMHDVCDKLSKLYVMQDDYLDCYADEAATGKVGNDIQQGKCSWFAVTALQRCNEAQRQLFTKHYASENPEDVAIIKKLYGDLQLEELFKQREVELYNDIIRHVHALSSSALTEYFLIIIDKITKKS